MREYVINRLMQYLVYSMVVRPEPLGKDAMVSVGGNMRHIAIMIAEYQHINSGDQIPKFRSDFRLIVTTEVLNTLTDEQLTTAFEAVIRYTYTQR